MIALSELSEAELSLWRAFPSGAWVDLRDADPRSDPDPGEVDGWPERRMVRAEVIASLLLGAAGTEPGSCPGIRLRGARITGRLDLMGATAGCGLLCEYCRIDAQPWFEEAVTRTIRIDNSWLPGFNGARMRAEGMFSLYESAVPGTLVLDRAKITGEVLLASAVLGEGSGTAVAADGMTVDGDLDCRRMASRGAVKLQGARISGLVRASGAAVSCPGPRALDADNAVIGGYFAGSNLKIDGEMLLEHAQIGGYLDLRGAQLNNPGGWAFAGGGLTVTGGLWCHDGFTARGEVRLIGARITGGLRLTAGRLDAPGQTALNLDRATLGDVDAIGLVADGTVSLTGARVAATVNFSDASLSNTGGVALAMDGIDIGDMLNLVRFSAIGEVAMRAGRVSGRIFLNEAVIRNAPEIALRLSRAEAMDVLCDAMTVSGVVRFTGLRVIRHVRLTRVHLENPGDIALDAYACQAGEFSLIPDGQVNGEVRLGQARLGVYRDDPSCWPSQLRVDGLSYDVLEPWVPASQRLRWLTSGMATYQAQPFEQLAAFYTRIGQPGQARRVLQARERRLRSLKTPLGRGWSLLQDLTVGYGYQPWRAALWFLAFLAAGSIVYSAAQPHALDPATAPHFNAVAYTLDLLLPVVDLGQKHSFDPTGVFQWLSYLFIAAGWILVTTIAAGIARTLRRLTHTTISGTPMSPEVPRGLCGVDFLYVQLSRGRDDLTDGQASRLA